MALRSTRTGLSTERLAAWVISFTFLVLSGCSTATESADPAPAALSPVQPQPSSTSTSTSTSAPSASALAPDHSATSSFVYTNSPLEGEALERSSWNTSCPVAVEQLRHLTVSYIDFSGQTSTGELVVNSLVADDIVQVFRSLFDAGYQMSEMRITTQSDIDNPDPESNNTGSFACRAVIGSTTFSQHAYGLAVDINPFYNPYSKQGVVLPAGAVAYLDRSLEHPAIIGPESPVVEAFSSIGWGWGGTWSSLVDYQHFSLNNR